VEAGRISPPYSALGTRPRVDIYIYIYIYDASVTYLLTTPASKLSPLNATSTDMTPQKIIIDTDPGVDDVLAILMGLASPEVDVALISIVFGNTHAPVAHSNLLKIYHSLAHELSTIPDAGDRYARLAQQDKTVLALGEDGPIGGTKAVAAYFVGLGMV
jgi:hypothetical protein